MMANKSTYRKKCSLCAGSRASFIRGLPVSSHEAAPAVGARCVLQDVLRARSFIFPKENVLAGKVPELSWFMLT